MPSRPLLLRPAVLLVSLLFVLTGCGAADEPDGTTASPSAGVSTPVVPRPASPVREEIPASPPVRVEIPSIGVDSEIIALGLRDDGTLEVPEGDDYDRAGYYDGGPTPGERGPAVIAGHVDSKSGPSVFYRLRDLRPGDEIKVTREDGRVLTFTAEKTNQYPKDELPTEDVYGPVPWSALRLITCGGDFDRSQRSYQDNLIVSARLTQA